MNDNHDRIYSPCVDCFHDNTSESGFHTHSAYLRYDKNIWMGIANDIELDCCRVVERKNKHLQQ